jgi:hypothetical protein
LAEGTAYTSVLRGELVRGRQNQSGRTPRAFAKSHPPTDLFSSNENLSSFLGVSRQGEFKNSTTMFAQKPLSRGPFFVINKKSDMCVCSLTFLFYRISGRFVVEEFKNTTQRFLIKKYVEFGTKKVDKFGIFFTTLFI